jgi:hypothetical protein
VNGNPHVVLKPDSLWIVVAEWAGIGHFTKTLDESDQASFYQLSPREAMKGDFSVWRLQANSVKLGNR